VPRVGAMALRRWPAGARILVAAAGLLLAGCGSASGVRAGPPSGLDSEPVCGDVVITPQSGDATRAICLSIGSTLRIQFGAEEQSPTERGVALHEVSPGLYRGAQAGTAEVSGFRRACPSARPGASSCHAIAGWKVTVDVQ